MRQYYTHSVVQMTFINHFQLFIKKSQKIIIRNQHHEESLFHLECLDTDGWMTVRGYLACKVLVQLLPKVHF